MRLHELLTDDGAVSPVIGVILMVALTVILATVVGSFVLGLGSSLESPPSASFSFDFDDGGGGFGTSDGDDSVEITHEGGDSIDAGSLKVVVAGTDVTSLAGWSNDVTAGDSTTVTDGDAAMETDDEVRVVWSSGDGKSATIGIATVP
jgi:FlaG/FlaF family flagellin (archaellin)